MGQRKRNGQNKLKVKRHHDVISANKKFTRKHAESALSRGADPAEMVERDGKVVGRFTDHANYHVRAKAWRKMGMPLPEGADEKAKFLASIHVKVPAPVEAEVAAEPIA